MSIENDPHSAELNVEAEQANASDKQQTHKSMPSTKQAKSLSKLIDDIPEEPEAQPF